MSNGDFQILGLNESETRVRLVALVAEYPGTSVDRTTNGADSFSVVWGRIGDPNMSRHPGSILQRSSAFTLIELLVVIAIIAIMVGILIPALKGSRTAAQLARCQSNTRQMVMAANTYANDNKDRIWPARGWGIYGRPIADGPNSLVVYEIGLLFQYCDNAEEITECPANKRSRESGPAPQRPPSVGLAAVVALGGTGGDGGRARRGRMDRARASDREKERRGLCTRTAGGLS